MHLSHIKQIYSQTTHLAHELKSCIQIIRRRVDLAKTPQWKLLAGAEIWTIFLPRLISYHNDSIEFFCYSDVSIILSSTDFWSGKSIDDISESEYLGLMTSHVVMTSHAMNNISGLELRNCSIQDELDQVKFFDPTLPLSSMFCDQ